MKFMDYLNKTGLFMFTADTSFWRGKIASNRYFATLSVLFTLLMGLVTAEKANDVRRWLKRSFLEWETTPSLVAAIGVLLVVVALNICESVMAAKSFVSGLLRALWVTVVLIAAFFATYFIGNVASDLMGYLLLTITILFVVAAVTNIIMQLWGEPEGQRI